jgi:hypothetical protein
LPNADAGPEHMPATFLAAFQTALSKTHDWMGPAAGIEPRCSFEDKEYPVSEFFDLMMPFVHDRLNDLDLWLVHKILSDARGNERAAIDANPTYGNAARLLSVRIAERKRQLERHNIILGE